MWLSNGYIIPIYRRPKGPIVPPPALEEYIILETSPYSGGGVEYSIQENAVAPDDKMEIETAP